MVAVGISALCFVGPFANLEWFVSLCMIGNESGLKGSSWIECESGTESDGEDGDQCVSEEVQFS